MLLKETQNLIRNFSASVASSAQEVDDEIVQSINESRGLSENSQAYLNNFWEKTYGTTVSSWQVGTEENVKAHIRLTDHIMKAMQDWNTSFCEKKNPKEEV